MSGRSERITKFYKDIVIAIRDFDEYAFFKRSLVLSYQNDRELLKKLLMEGDKKFARAVEIVMRCKRVRVAREGNKEYIRFIF